MRAVLRRHAAGRRRARLDRLPHRSRSVRSRREDLRRPRRPARRSPARARGGAPTSRRSTTSRRRRRSRRAHVLCHIRRMPRRRIRGNRAGIRNGAAARGAAGAARRPLAAQSSGRDDVAARGDPKADARHVLRRYRRLEGAGLRAGARGRIDGACTAWRRARGRRRDRATRSRRIGYNFPFCDSAAARLQAAGLQR